MSDAGGDVASFAAPVGQPPMRVLHIGPTPFFSDRGCHVRIRGLIHALTRRRIQSRLCTYHHGRETDGVETVRSLRVPGYTQVDAGPAPLKYVADALLFARVCGQLRRWRPDIVHGHLHEGALIGWAASKLMFWRRTPVIFDMQGSLVGELQEHGYFEGAGMLRRLFERVEGFIDRRPAAIACSSRSSLEIARDRFGIAAERLHLVADGVDAMPPDAAGSADVRRQLGLPEGVPVVVYAGSLLPVKGLPTLHEVILSSARRGLGLHFLLVGYPTEQTTAFVREHELSACCTLADRVPFERVGEYLGLGAMAIEPKVSDSGEASGKVLNYMAAGLPVVCFDTPNNREILGDSGCYASPGSASSLVDQLEALSPDPARCEELGRRGRARVQAQFSWDASAGRLLEIYRTVLNRPR